MSYNIDNIEVVHIDARMRAHDVRALCDEYDLPEMCFLEEMIHDADDADDMVCIPSDKFWWSGEGSGHTFDDVFMSYVAPKIVGQIEAIITYEGGDSVIGLLVKDGKATTCEVEMRLVKPEGW